MLRGRARSVRRSGSAGSALAKPSVKSPIAPWITVPRSRAPGGVSMASSGRSLRICLRVDRIGIAQPVFDLGDRQARSAARRAAASAPGASTGSTSFGPVERARQREIMLAARERVLPVRSPATAASRCTKREATVGAPASFGGAGQDDFLGAEPLREIMRGQADAPLRQVEAKLLPHRPAQPGIAARLRRPRRLRPGRRARRDRRWQARFERTVDAHARIRRARPAHDAVGGDRASNSSA